MSSLSLSLSAALLGASAPAAYSSPALYSAPTWEGGGGGRHFTGTRVDGQSCEVCHGGGEPLALELAGLPVGGWEPGATYTIDISWSPMVEHAGVLAEIADAKGVAVGELSLPPDELLTNAERCSSGTRAASDLALEDGRQLLAIGDCGAHRLRFQWQAPSEPPARVDGQADAGPWLHLASVRGDGSGDVQGDGPGLQVIPLPMSGEVQTSGCQLSAPNEHSRPAMAVGAGLLALLGLRTRRRRRPHQGRGRPASLERGQLRSPSARELLHEPPALPRRPGRPARLALLGASLLPCLALLGCVRVQPWERERLAQPDMQMAVDPELSAGPDHAVEYREGSAGAFGGAGGGCGCN